MKPLRLIRTSTFQLAWWYMGIFGASALILVYFVHWATVGQLERQIDTNIVAETASLLDEYREHGTGSLARLIRLRLEQRRGERVLYLLGRSGERPIAGNLRELPLDTPAEPGWYEFTFRDDRGRPAPGRGLLLRLDGLQDERPHDPVDAGLEDGLDDRLDDGRYPVLHLLVGRDFSDLQASRRLVYQAYGWSFVLGIALAALGGTLMSLSVTRRIDAINRTSREIMTGRLQERMPVRGVNDEFDQLAQNLNAMLDRMDILIDGVRSVADNIAHDLRTPLTRLRARLEALSARGDVDEELRLELAAAQDEADHLLATFRALLRIARIESGSHEGALSEVDLGALAEDAWELYQALGDEKGVQLSCHPRPVHVQGDRDLLFQAIANLVDNAIKYSPPDSAVELVVTEDDEHAAITVSDHGRGIPPEEMGKVLGRFYRASTSTGVSGSGLGLALVNAIATRHGGEVILADNAPGLRVTLRLPKEPPASPVRPA